MQVNCVLFDLKGGFDLDADAIGERREPDGRSSVATLFAEDLNKQVGASVDHLGLAFEIRGTVDHAQHLDRPRDAIEVTVERLPGRREDLQATSRAA